MCNSRISVGKCTAYQGPDCDSVCVLPAFWKQHGHCIAEEWGISLPGFFVGDFALFSALRRTNAHAGGRTICGEKSCGD